MSVEKCERRRPGWCSVVSVKCRSDDHLYLPDGTRGCTKSTPRGQKSGCDWCCGGGLSVNQSVSVIGQENVNIRVQVYIFQPQRRTLKEQHDCRRDAVNPFVCWLQLAPSVSPDRPDWHQKAKVTPMICFSFIPPRANHVFSLATY